MKTVTGVALLADAGAQLQAQIARLKSLTSLGKDAAPVVAAAVKKDTAKQVASATGPDGRAWKLTKDGRVPLRNAAAHVQVTAVGNVVLMRLEGHHARHHLGAVRGKVKREIIPTERMPDPMTKTIERVITGEFERVMGGK